jgi:putative ABC transport system ATP-binding protein
MLFKLNKEDGVTLVVVTHDKDLADRCNTVINIKDGKIQSIEKARANK